MSHTPHELHDEFPDDAETLHELKTGSAHFTKLSDKYHELNREIHRIEAGVEASSDARAEDLKKERLVLLDEIAAMISQAKAGAK
ncbi:YdcH family protein [Sphingorhabdus sp.]|jgi:uncharacterized protein YdcH (DUF465 family)|uniref:YdcH family protein n=1 Tax=Sphingorhabdus sp. TaxID=1902408 RepID=UPI003BB18CB9|nr:DUF465 domain-containing protein [Sphingomonadales bacterium]MBK9433483.1 DUF465 domain-containing protein [Sphingomonadales bacterium]